MYNLKTHNMRIRKNNLVSDNSDYFSKWGSRNPTLTIREELDNQIAAKPTYAGITITSRPGGKCIIETFNDGITPTPERMEKMNHIGKTISDRHGASICGVGQIEGLVAGRKSPRDSSRLKFISVHSGQKCTFTCVVNGYDYTITTENIGPEETDEQDYVKKTYEGMRDIDESGIEYIKLLCSVKLAPYINEHPDFKYTVNGEVIKPIDILYQDVDDDSVKHMNVKEFKITYHGHEYVVKAGATDFSRYVKPDSLHLDESNANDWDKYHNMSMNGTGVFVEIGGVNVITGGKDSWKLIGREAHTTHNGQNIWISIPAEGELKDAIFAESPNKSDVSICFTEVFDFDTDENIFSSMIDEINIHLNTWTKDRNIIGLEGKTIKREQEKVIMNSLVENFEFMSKISGAFKALPDETLQLLSSKKIKTILDIVSTNQSEGTALF